MVNSNGRNNKSKWCYSAILNQSSPKIYKNEARKGNQGKKLVTNASADIYEKNQKNFDEISSVTNLALGNYIGIVHSHNND
jgi:hypothetical protein